MLEQNLMEKLLRCLNVVMNVSEYIRFWNIFIDYYNVTSRHIFNNNAEFELFLFNNSKYDAIRPFYLYYKHLDSDLLMYQYIFNCTGKNNDDISKMIYELSEWGMNDTYDRVRVLQTIHFIAHSLSIRRCNNILSGIIRRNDVIFSMFDDVQKKGYDINKITDYLSDDISDEFSMKYGELFIKYGVDDLVYCYEVAEYLKSLDDKTIKSMTLPDTKLIIPKYAIHSDTFKRIDILIEYSLLFQLKFMTKYEKPTFIKPTTDTLAAIDDVIEV